MHRAQYREYDPYWREPAKECSSCRIFKGLSQFHKQKAGSYGVFRQCKRCALENYRKYYKKKKKILCTKQRNRRGKNRLHYREYQRKLYHKNIEYRRAYLLEYRAKTKLHRRAWGLKWRHSVKGHTFMLMTYLKRLYRFQVGYDELLEWLNSQGYNKMMKVWQDNGYDYKHSPCLLIKSPKIRWSKKPQELDDFKLVTKTQQMKVIVKDNNKRKKANGLQKRRQDTRNTKVLHGAICSS